MNSQENRIASDILRQTRCRFFVSATAFRRRASLPLSPVKEHVYRATWLEQMSHALRVDRVASCYTIETDHTEVVFPITAL